METTETVALYRRMKILTPVTYAREALAPGELVTVDPVTAATWLRDAIAVESDEPPPCWKCGALPLPRPRANVRLEGR